MVATYFVANGTGTQGGAVIEQLLKLQPKPVIRTTSRNLNSSAVKKLQEQGVEVIEGGQADKEALKKGLTGAQKVFSVQNVIITSTGIDGDQEAEAARVLIEAAKESGTVKQVVHSSVVHAGLYLQQVPSFIQFANDSHMTSYWEGKKGAEEAVRKSGIDYTIIRPGFINCNYLSVKASYNQPGLIQGEFYNVTHDMGHVVPDDIGKFAVAAFNNPEKFNKREVDFVGENLSAEQVVDVLESVSGKKIKLIQFTKEEALAHPNKMWHFAHFLNNITKPIDVEGIKREYPEIKFTPFKEYIQKNKDFLAIGSQ